MFGQKKITYFSLFHDPCQSYLVDYLCQAYLLSVITRNGGLFDIEYDQ